MASPTAMTTRLSSLRTHSKNPLQAAMAERSQHARRLHLTPESPRPGASKTVADSVEKRRLLSIGLRNSAFLIDLEAGKPRRPWDRPEWKTEWIGNWKLVGFLWRSGTWVAACTVFIFSGSRDEKFNNEELQ
jgi:hypothetical protein